MGSQYVAFYSHQFLEPKFKSTVWPWAFSSWDMLDAQFILAKIYRFDEFLFLLRQTRLNKSLSIKGFRSIVRFDGLNSVLL